MRQIATRLSVLAALVMVAAGLATAQRPPERRLEAIVDEALQITGARGLAVAVVRNGQVAGVTARGIRNATGAPLTTDTVMYGASLTKALFAWTVMQLVEEGRLDLDATIDRYLGQPLPSYPADPKYGPWQDLAGDPRWRRLTPRILLTHSAGFANFAFVEPDGKLRIHFEPGSRYAYSGEGLILLQFVLEKGLGLDVGVEMQRRLFDKVGARNTSMMWRADFAANLADGWKADGTSEPHDERSKVRAAGSMDTTIADMARLAAAYVRGEGLSPAGRADLTRPHLPITTASQFPPFQPELPPQWRIAGLAAGLGVIVFEGPQGRGFFKGGHNDSTGNTWVCVERTKDCVVILANDVRAEPAFPGIVRALLGETGVPWQWEYGEMGLLH